MCPICNGGSATSLDDDAHSATSGKSNRSNTSRKSTRSMITTTTSSRVLSEKAKSSRFGTVPFDSDGYCSKHPSVQIAQRKLLGGYKIIHDICPDCAREDARSVSNRSRSRNGGVRSRSLSQQRRRTHDGCSPRQKNNNTIMHRGSIASDITSFKQKLYSEFRM
jgi:hypothetical protein